MVYLPSRHTSVIKKLHYIGYNIYHINSRIDYMIDNILLPNEPKFVKKERRIKMEDFEF